MSSQRILNNIHSYRVLDGDTIEVLGQIWTAGIYVKQKVRLAGIDTPEKSTNAGKAVQKHIIDLLGAIKEFRVTCTDDDKYSGRFVGEVLLGAKRLANIVEGSVHNDYNIIVGDVSLNSYLRREGLAKEYLGTTKAKWTEQELRNVENTCAGLIVRTSPISFSLPPEDRWVVVES